MTPVLLPDVLRKNVCVPAPTYPLVAEKLPAGKALKPDSPVALAGVAQFDVDFNLAPASVCPGRNDEMQD